MEQRISKVLFATDDPKENNLVLYTCPKYKPTIIQIKYKILQNTKYKLLYVKVKQKLDQYLLNIPVNI